MKNREWNHKTDELRTLSSQRFKGQHPRRNASLSTRRDGDINWTSNSRLNRRETVSGPAVKDTSGTDADEGRLNRRETISGPAVKDVSGTNADKGNVEQLNDRAQVIDQIKTIISIESWADSEKKWKGKEDGLYGSPPMSPSSVRPPTRNARLARERRRHKSLVRSKIPVPKSIADRSWTDREIDPKLEDRPDRDSELEPSESEQVEITHHEGFQAPKIQRMPDEDDEETRQAGNELIRCMEEGHFTQTQWKGRDDDYDPQSQSPNTGGTLCDDDDRVIKGDFGLRISTNEPGRDRVSQPKLPETDSEMEMDETHDRRNEPVSDKSKKPNETEQSSETPVGPNKDERYSADSVSHPSGPAPTFVDANPVQDPVEEQFDDETNKAKVTLDPPHSPGTMEKPSHDSGPTLARSDDIKRPNPQSNNPESDINESPDATQSPSATNLSRNTSSDAQLRSPDKNDMETSNRSFESSDGDGITRPDPQPESLENETIEVPKSNPQSSRSEGVNDKTNSVREKAQEEGDPEAWLKSGAPLAGNYKAFLHNPRRRVSLGLDSPSDRGSSGDSLIVSPARSDELENSDEEDWNSTAIANEQIINMFDEHKEKSQLQPASEEEEARYWRKAKVAVEKAKRPRSMGSGSSSTSTPNSDRSFLLSPGQYDEKSGPMSVAVGDDLDKAGEEEEGEDEDEDEEDGEDNQAIMDLIELHRTNYEQRKDMEANEAKFKQEIKLAWKRPRPPPTTEEQRLDRIALANIESKEMFDEFGEQQRPIRTDPQLVLRETEINIMITRARVCFLLEDYRRMYTRANQAAAAASLLKYPPLTARCCYYRGLASYFHRDFSSARDDFVEARGCAGLYDISSESIEEYIHLIDSAVDPYTAILERVPVQEASGGRNAGRPRRIQRTLTPVELVSSPSTADDAMTLVGEPPRSPARSQQSRPEEERPTSQPPENTDSQTQVVGRLSTSSTLPTNGDPQPATEDVPAYQPQEKAISEEIRKDILESKAQSLSADNEAAPAETHYSQEESKKELHPQSMASTEWTVLGTNASPSPTRRVPRPHVAPITTSFGAAGNPTREALPHATPGSEDADDRRSDEIGSDEVFGAFGGRPGEGSTPDSAQSSDE